MALCPKPLTQFDVEMAVAVANAYCDFEEEGTQLGIQLFLKALPTENSRQEFKRLLARKTVYDLSTNRCAKPQQVLNQEETQILLDTVEITSFMEN